MIGTAVERQGIIRHGAKMITAVSEATVPKVSVIVRKAYGAGLYAMSGPAFEPEATIALPTAKIAVMGPEAAVNAVFANKIAAIDDPDEREAFVVEQRRLYEEDVDLLRLASELVVDAVVDFPELRDEIVAPAARGAGQGPLVQRTAPRRATRVSRRCRSVRTAPSSGSPNSMPADGRVPDVWRADRHTAGSRRVRMPIARRGTSS